MECTGAFEVIGGRVYQWDTGRQVRITPKAGETIAEAHFDRKGDANAPVVLPALNADGSYTADIPNILLQTAESVTVYAVTQTASGTRTIMQSTISVRARPRPEDYVYTETEVLSYSSLAARIDELERNGVSAEQIEAAVNAYLSTHPAVTTDETLRFDALGRLSVVRAEQVQQDNTLPITSAAVYAEVGNINALLATI